MISRKIIYKEDAPEGTTHYSHFRLEIDFFKEDKVRGSWFVYDDNKWIPVYMEPYFRHQKILKIYEKLPQDNCSHEETRIERWSDCFRYFCKSCGKLTEVKQYYNLHGESSHTIYK